MGHWFEVYISFAVLEMNAVV